MPQTEVLSKPKLTLNPGMLQESDTPFGPKTWLRSWKDQTPLISASKKFYGVPEAILIIIWTHILENDEPETFRVRPSLMEDVFHAQETKFKVTRARTLLQINKLSRSIALQRFRGTLPIFAGEGKPPRILRFIPEKDIIRIEDFHLLILQMITPPEDDISRSYEDNQSINIEYRQAEECFMFYPKNPQVARLKARLETQNRPLSKLKVTYQISLIREEFEAISFNLPHRTWERCRSIQNLAITTVNPSLRTIYRHMFRGHHRRQFTPSYGPIPTFLNLLRENGNYQNLYLDNDKGQPLRIDDHTEQTIRASITLYILFNSVNWRHLNS